MVCLLCVLVTLTAGRASAAGLTYVYDDLGRLSQVIDAQGNAATYTYDALGNILAIDRPPPCPVQAPTVSSVMATAPSDGSAGQLTIQGNSLLGASVSADNPQVTLRNCLALCTQLTCTLTNPFGAVGGSLNLTVTTSSGSTQATASIPPEPICGDGIVQAGEDCDDGGVCIGGSNAGTACTSDEFCGLSQPGVCSGSALRCMHDADCTGGDRCVRCKPFGGDGCAANCTTESDVPYLLVPGLLNGTNLAPGTSGVGIDSDFIAIPLSFGDSCVGGNNAGVPCAGSGDCPGGTCTAPQQTLTVGKQRDGKIPVVVKAASVKIPGSPVGELVCGCVRGVAGKTCGGTFFEPDGVTLSPDCTAGDSVCAGKAPCTFLYGAGNAASGEIGCENGLDGVNASVEQDSGGASFNSGPPLAHLTGHGRPGSAVIYQTLGITTVLGGCTGNDPSTYGKDGIFCTADDPPGGTLFSSGSTLPEVTGTASVVVHNANGNNQQNLGPVTAAGAPFSCSALVV